jgi:hypothetical protein
MTQTFRVGSMSMRIESNVIKWTTSLQTPYQSIPKTNGFNNRFSIYQVGFASVLDKGIEISMGFDKST